MCCCCVPLYGGSQCSMHIILQPRLPVRPAWCHGVSGMASSSGLHIKPAAVGNVLASHSRHTSQSSADTKLDNVKRHSRANRLQWIFTKSAHTKDDCLTVWQTVYYLKYVLIVFSLMWFQWDNVLNGHIVFKKKKKEYCSHKIKTLLQVKALHLKFKHTEVSSSKKIKNKSTQFKTTSAGLLSLIH